jgi:hypothetical protein
VVAAATLAVAALFQPARRRVQAVVDRRFNRRRHDATRIIEGFGARLRDQVDLDTLTADCWRWSTRPCSRPRHRCWLRSPPKPPRTPPGALASPTLSSKQPIRAGRSASARTAPDGSSLLRLDTSSVQTAPDRSRRDRLDDHRDDQSASSWEHLGAWVGRQAGHRLRHRGRREGRRCRRYDSPSSSTAPTGPAGPPATAAGCCPGRVARAGAWRPTAIDEGLTPADRQCQA